MKQKPDLTRVVLYSVSGGVLTAVIGVLGTQEAHAEPRDTAGQPSGPSVKKVTPSNSNNSGSANAAEKKVEKYDKFKKDSKERERNQGSSSSAIADRDIAKADKDAEEQRRGRTAGSTAIADREVKREDEKKELDKKAKKLKDQKDAEDREQERKAKALKFQEDARERLKNQGSSSSAIADRDIAKANEDAEEQRRGRTAGSSAIADREVAREDEKKELEKKAREAAFEQFLNGDGRTAKDGGGLRGMLRDVLTAGPTSGPADEIPGMLPQVPRTPERDPGGGGRIAEDRGDGVNKNADSRAGQVPVNDPNDHLVGNVADEVRETIVENLESFGEAVQTVGDLGAMTRIPVSTMGPLTATSTATVPARERKAAEERNVQRGQALADAVQDPGILIDEVVRPYAEDWNSDKPERAFGRGAVDLVSVIVPFVGLPSKVANVVDGLTGRRGPDSDPDAAGAPQKPDPGPDAASPPQPGSGEPAPGSPLPGGLTPNPDSTPTEPDPQNPTELADNAAPVAGAPATGHGSKGDTAAPGTPSRSTNDGDRPGTTVLPTQATQLPTLPNANRGDSPARRSGDASRRDTSDDDDSRSRPTRRDTGIPSSPTSDDSESRQQSNDRTPVPGTNAPGGSSGNDEADTAEQPVVDRCPTNSFVPGTLVLMADGSRKRIEDIKVGDLVAATDPETGRSGARAVAALITGAGQKDLVDITIDTDGDAGDATGTIVATDGHPFWNDSSRTWTDADDLTPGQRLRTPDGRSLAITATRQRTVPQTVHNLSITDINTYYVVAGDSPVLVHNVGPPCIPSTAGRGEPRMTDGTAKEGWRHIWKRHIPGAADPSKQGTLFAPGTTRAQIEAAAKEILRHGTRQSKPDRDYQTFERRMMINGKRANYRLIIEPKDGNKIITMFPIGE